jgi:hypothetical protein
VSRALGPRVLCEGAVRVGRRHVGSGAESSARAGQYGARATGARREEDQEGARRRAV